MRAARIISELAVTVAVIAAAAPPASAATRFVGTNGNDAQTSCTTSPGCATVQRAVDLADPGDTIRVLAGQHAGATVTKPLTFVGDGAGTFPAPADPARHTIIRAGLRLQAGGVVRQMRVTGQGAGTFGVAGLALGASGAQDTYTVQDAIVVCGPGAFTTAALTALPDAGASGLSATVSRSTLACEDENGQTGSTGVIADGGAGLPKEPVSVELADSAVVSFGTGLVADRGAALVVRRTTVDAVERPVAVRGATFSATQAVIRGGDSLDVETGGAEETAPVVRLEDSLLDVRRRAPSQAGALDVVTQNRATTVQVLRSTISSRGGGAPGVRVFPFNTPATVALRSTAVQADGADLRAEGSSATGTITATYSAYAQRSATANGAIPAPGSGTNLAGDPGFRDAAGGDFAPAIGSPLLERGEPTDAPLDLVGAPRTLDGDGDGAAAPDIGALECLPGACLAPPAPGAAAPAGGPAAGPGPFGTLRDVLAPVLGDVGMTSRRFAVAPLPRGSARAAQAPRGTRFRWTLSESALVTVRVERALAGRRSGTRCLAPRRGRGGRACRRFVLRRTLRTRAAAGAGGIAFTGRIGRRALPRGAYRARIAALDTAGNRSRESALTFTIVRAAPRR